MEQWRAEEMARALRNSGYGVVAAPIDPRRVGHGWLVRPSAAVNGWANYQNMPTGWRRAIDKYMNAKDPNKMDKATAGRYAAALRTRTGNISIHAVPDISTGNEDGWGLQYGDEVYWEYDAFPEHWRREIQAHAAVSNGTASEEVTVTLTRLQAGVALGLLSAETHAAGSGEYGDLLADVVRKLGLSLVRGA